MNPLSNWRVWSKYVWHFDRKRKGAYHRPWHWLLGCPVSQVVSYYDGDTICNECGHIKGWEPRV